MKLLLLLTFLSLQNLFAIISIAPVEIGESPGISGSVELGLDTKRGNTHKDYYKSTLKINYDENTSYVLWAQFSGEYGEANHIEDTNKLYSHMRFIHKLTSKSLVGEIFIQAQEDRYQAIKRRRLIGGGIRAELFETLGGKGYAGCGPMYELIRHTDPILDPDEDNLRLNTYLAYSLKLNEASDFAYTLYYQPILSEFSEYAISSKIELQLNIYLELFLKFSVYYNVDSSPPSSLEKNWDFGQTTTFEIEF